jgi:nicotinamidase-related amidase
MNTHLLIIDPQNDFCDPQGALFVPGADQDAARLADLINRLGNKIDDIHTTLDSHRVIDVAHPIFWINSKGEHPQPFTIISKDDVVNGVWTTTNPAWRQRAIDYVTTLETNARYPLCIWPPHCLIGTWGHAVMPCV